MADVLKRICDDKLAHIAECKTARPLSQIETAATAAAAPRGFYAALKSASRTGYGLIAEIKKASPSKGLIRPDFDPPSLARSYQAGGATCLSVLTDAPYFQGDDSYLGADCILLIMAALSDAQAAELEEAAVQYGMDVLVEVHNREELDRALKLKSPMLGVNNRNLKTLTVDLATTEALAGAVPADRMLICESGLYSADDLARMAEVGARCFLIGESFMRQDDVAAAVQAILADPVPARVSA